MDFLLQLFAANFPHQETVSGFWTEGYDGDPRGAMLLRRA
jgi:hypothetical protein